MAKNCVIFETLNEARTLQPNVKEDGFMHLSGVFGVCGVRNNNKRIYEKNNYAKMVSEMQTRLPIPGELEHPKSLNTSLENVSHRIDSINIDENGVVSGEITLLNTPKGKIAQEIIKGGMPLFISSRAQGNVDKNGMVTLETLQTFDLVGSPGFSQAKLHLNENQIVESLTDNVFYITEKENDDEENEDKKTNENMTTEEIISDLKDEINDLKETIDYLQKDIKNMNENNAPFDMEQFADNLQDWLVNEYAPEIQKWVVEEYSEGVQNWLVNDFSKEIQKWVVEEYSKELQNWLVEHYTEKIQQWIIEEYSPEIQDWIVKEYSNGLQKWVEEHVMPETQNQVQEAIEEHETLKSADKLDSIDKMISVLEGMAETKQQKPNYPNRVLLNEDIDAPRYIKEMPAEARVKWNMASDEVKESIKRRAKLYNFMVEGAIERFWDSVNFENIAPAKNIYEGLDDIKDSWERSIRAQLRSRFRKF